MKQMYSVRFYVCILLLVLLSFTCRGSSDPWVIPLGFGYVHEVIDDARYDVRYFGYDNFVGRPVDGYLEPVAILSLEALEALVRVADELRQQGYGIIVFDGYRPQKAVDHFIRWARDAGDTLTKAKYYPNINKSELFSMGFIASRSSHTRGSAVDLTLYDLKTGTEVDMGSIYDFFGPVSAHGSPLITPEQHANRTILRQAMVKHGFSLLEHEWWHYSLRDEPFPETYFNFNVF